MKTATTKKHKVGQEARQEERQKAQQTIGNDSSIIKKL